MDDDPTIQCPLCDMWFSVVWNLDPVIERPEYCPFCGGEIDYAELWREQHQENDDK